EPWSELRRSPRRVIGKIVVRHLGLDEPGTEKEHWDSSGQLIVERLAVPCYGGLAGRIGGAPRAGKVGRAARGYHYAAGAALEYPGVDRAAAKGDAEDVDSEAPPPVGRLDLPGRAIRAADPGIGGEQRQRPELLFGLGDGTLDRAAVGDVELDCEPVDLAGDLIDLRARPRGHGNAGACGGALVRDARPDPTAASGDEGDLAFKLPCGSHRPRIREQDLRTRPRGQRPDGTVGHWTTNCRPGGAVQSRLVRRGRARLHLPAS